MNQVLIDKESVAAPRSPERKSSIDLDSWPPTHEAQPAEKVACNTSGSDQTAGFFSPDLSSAWKCRQRSEELARQLPEVEDLDQFIAIAQEHGRLAVARAAAFRPDLLPELNGEFAHITLSLADLD